MKKHNLLKTVSLVFLLTIILSWVLNGTSYQMALEVEPDISIGLFQIMQYPMNALSFFVWLPLLLFSIAGFYAVLYKTGTYGLLIEKIVKFSEGDCLLNKLIKKLPKKAQKKLGKKINRKWLILSLITIVFALLSALVGTNYVLLMFIPFAVTMIVAMGYDKVTAALATVGGVAIGTLGGFFQIEGEYYSQILMVDVDYLMLTRVFLFIIALVLLIAYNIIRSKKHMAEKVEIELPKVDKKKKLWPMIALFVALLAIYILGFANWQGFPHNSMVFTDFMEKVNTNVFWSRLLGSIETFGTWRPENIVYVLLFSTLLLKFVYKIKFDDLLDSYAEGMKKAIKPIVLSLIIFAVLVATVYHPFVLTIVKPLVDAVDVTKIASLRPLLLSLATLVSSLFYFEPIYGISYILPYVASIYTSGALLSVTTLVWQAMTGFSILLFPTSLLLILTLSYLELPYTKYIKHVWKFLLALFLFIQVYVLLLA